MEEEYESRISGRRSKEGKPHPSEDTRGDSGRTEEREQEGVPNSALAYFVSGVIDQTVANSRQAQGNQYHKVAKEKVSSKRDQGRIR